MPVESAADRAALLADFGVMAIYEQARVPAFMIRGLFDRQHLLLDVGDGTVSGYSVAFSCSIDDLVKAGVERPLQQDRISIGYDSWDVVEPQADGTGMVTFILRKSS